VGQYVDPFVSDGPCHYVSPPFGNPISLLMVSVPSPVFLTEINVKEAWQFRGLL
jgi:hypothetical protein